MRSSQTWENALICDDEGEHVLLPDEIGYVFSVPVLPDFLTGEEFVRFFMDINPGSDRDGSECGDIFRPRTD